MAQFVKYPSLDLLSGFDLRVVSSSPALGSTLGLEPKQRKVYGTREQQSNFLLLFENKAGLLKVCMLPLMG